MEKISYKEVFVLTFFVSVTLFIGFGDVRMMTVAGNSSLLSILIGTVIGMIPILIIVYISKFTKNDSLFTVLKDKFGVFGIILNILLCICAIAFLFLTSWLFVQFVISQFLTRNSYYILAIVFFGICAFTASKGIQVISRVSLIFYMITFIAIIIIIGFLIPNVEINNILPIFDVSKTNFIKSIFLISCLAAIPCFIILGIPRKNLVDEKKYKYGLIFGYVLACLICLMILFFIISVYGVDLAKIFSYPSYNVLKKIHALNFIERVENIASVSIFAFYFGSFFATLHFCGECLKDSFSIKSKNIKNILIYVIGIIVPIISIWFFKKEYINLVYKNYPFISLGVLSLLIFIALLLFVSSFRQKKSHSTN